MEKSRGNYVTTQDDRKSFNRAWNRVDLEKNPSREITLRTNQILMMATFLVVSLFFILINYFLSRRLTGPIDSIVNTLKKIQDKQDYSLQVEKSSRDEIGIMIGEINGLLDYIEEENLQEKEQKRQLKRRAERDSLTGAMNKRAVEEKFLDIIQVEERITELPSLL